MIKKDNGNLLEELKQQELQMLTLEELMQELKRLTDDAEKDMKKVNKDIVRDEKTIEF